MPVRESAPGITYETPDPVATRILGDFIQQGRAAADYWTASVNAGQFISMGHADADGAMVALETLLGHCWTGAADRNSGVTEAALASRPVPAGVIAALRAVQVPADATYADIALPGQRRAAVYLTRAGARIGMPDRSAPYALGADGTRRRLPY